MIAKKLKAYNTKPPKIYGQPKLYKPGMPFT